MMCMDRGAGKGQLAADTAKIGCCRSGRCWEARRLCRMRSRLGYWHDRSPGCRWGCRLSRVIAEPQPHVG